MSDFRLKVMGVSLFALIASGCAAISQVTDKDKRASMTDDAEPVGFFEEDDEGQFGMFESGSFESASKQGGETESRPLSSMRINLDESDPEKLLRALSEKAPSKQDVMDSAINSVRGSSLYDTAYTLALQAGAKWRYDRINEELESNSDSLNAIYNFAPLMLSDGRVVPPVIVEAGGNMRLHSDDLRSENLRTFQIKADARMVSMPPSWRDYLIRYLSATDNVSSEILPRNPDERVLWREAAEKGWRDGIEQANSLFDLNMARLERDYRGIIRFQRLAKQGVVSMPQIAKGDLGIRVEEKTLSLGERIYRITDESSFQEFSIWKPTGSLKIRP